MYTIEHIYHKKILMDLKLTQLAIYIIHPSTISQLINILLQMDQKLGYIANI